MSPPEMVLPREPGGPWVMNVAFRQGEEVERVFFRVTSADAILPPLAMDALLPLVLVPAMKLGSPLRFSAPVTRHLLAGARRFQEIFSLWYPEFQPVMIHAEEVESTAPEPDARGAGVFFSGGLDSSFSLLKHSGELTHAIFVHGCDIPLENTVYRDRTVARLGETAKSCGVTLVVVETDLLRFSNQFCHWGYHYHGAALAAIAMLLSGTLRKVYIASSTSYVRVVPWGSSAITDPLWSTPLLEVVHDGAEKERLSKIQVLARFPVALRHLRVCFENPEQGYNCGQCEKCYRTMVGLRAGGALEGATAFDRPLDLAAMLEHPEVVAKFGSLRSWSVTHDIVRSIGTDHALILALDELHRRSAFVEMVRRFSQEKNDLIASPTWKAALPKFRTALLESLREEDPAWFTEKVLKWLPAVRDQAFTRLADHDRPWFKRSALRHRVRRLLEKLSRGRRRPSA